MTAKGRGKTASSPPEGKKGERLSEELERELEESFPASDPPSITQPGIKAGAPDHERRRPGK
ncbi:MAG TPA: hypothetical protein VFG05_05545 [Methylocella sp.]|nr:hypothetical protein [Methylocella sp.]